MRSVLVVASLVGALVISACGDTRAPAESEERAHTVAIGTELMRADLTDALSATGARLIVAAVYSPD